MQSEQINYEQEFKFDNATADHWCYKNAVMKDDCDKIIEFAKDKWSSGAIGGEYNPDNPNVDKIVRKSDVVWCDDNDLYKMVWSYVNDANECAKWKFQLDSCQTMQITRYQVGGHYDFHIDGNGFTREISNSDSCTNNKTRKLSMSIILNDDYEGGEFEFFSYPQNKNLIKEKTGTVIVFPSYLQHRVRPVTKGIRYSLVVWFCGEPFI